MCYRKCGQRMVWKLIFPVKAVDGATFAFFIEYAHCIFELYVIQFGNVGYVEGFGLNVHEKNRSLMPSTNPTVAMANSKTDIMRFTSHIDRTLK